ncbi:DNA-binding response regulator [Mucilaginibacter terrenus]|uniref:DNA-binding response regulator n=1 Tax=Mucilaginibacter terrenus TaxID=2482727 RepID=A0A3E2NVZ6_9SPHI|nr:response regulator transcription factor [Mucilaginibacter terrenus]RFZ85185.1 DNA-binding response regulator [Mucilaginibacter terrenus]
MGEKVLIAEDHESANISVRKTMDDLGLPHIHAYYCDDALRMLGLAIKHNEPYTLLVTDLSFEEDGSPQQLKSGEQLIIAARLLQPDLKVLVFSGEQRPAVIGRLFSELKIDGYVRKARHDAEHLRAAITMIGQHRRYLPEGYRESIRHLTDTLTEYERAIIRQLAGGMLQKQLPEWLQSQGMSNASLRSVEKALHRARTLLEVSNNQQLVAYCKDAGLI